jgi:RNA polymerase sigma-70 factor (ECF subfamily)
MDVDSSSIGDGEVVRRVVDGDVDSFEILLNRYRTHVFRIVNRHVPVSETDDVSQEAFIRAYRSLPSFKGTGDFKQWLSAIAVRTCYDFWRKYYRNRERPVSALSDNQRDWLEKITMDMAGETFTEQSVQKEAREILAWALDRVSAEDRMIIELVYLEGLTVKDASELLGWSVAKVKVRSFRSRKKLQKLMESSMTE